MADRAFFAALLLCTAAARGEDRFGDKGQVVPFGGVGYSHTSSSGRSTDSLAVAPGAVWFVADHIGVGLAASVIPVPHLFLGCGPFFAWSVEGAVSGSTALGLSSQIGGWF